MEILGLEANETGYPGAPPSTVDYGLTHAPVHELQPARSNGSPMTLATGLQLA
jgi:hypothetical protein